MFCTEHGTCFSKKGFISLSLTRVYKSAEVLNKSLEDLSAIGKDNLIFLHLMFEQQTRPELMMYLK